jgi:hypothetical protein
VLKASNSAGQSQTPKSPATREDGFKEVRRRKLHSTDEAARTSKKAVTTAASVAVDTPSRVVATRNFFAPLRTTGMETEPPSTQNNPQEEAAAVNPIQLQRQLKSMVSGNFELRNARNGTRVITRGMRISNPSNPISRDKTCPTSLSSPQMKNPYATSRTTPLL